MAAPLLPHTIEGKVTDSFGTLLTFIEVILINKENGSLLVTKTDSKGKYIENAGNFNGGYLDGDKVSVEVTNTFGDETKTETFTISGDSTTQNIQTEVILTLPSGIVGRTEKVSLVNASGKPYQSTNPLPVDNIGDRLYTRVYSYSGNFVQFQGWANPGSNKASAVWRIQKAIRNSKGRILDFVWADGDLNFDNIWKDRSGLQYS